MPRRLLPVLLALASAGVLAQAPPPYPVVFVHGLNSHDLAWRGVLEAVERAGWGVPYTYHADLNASPSTGWADDVVVAAPVPFRRFADGLTPDDSTVTVGTSAARRAPTESRVFVVNFRAYYDWDGGVVVVHSNRGAFGHSESNEAAAVKQGAALGAVVADVVAWTGAPYVVLVGHSMGGLAIREYLQRRGPDGAPSWWVDPSDPDRGHRVASVVTYGTPHGGSNASLLGLEAFVGVNPNSEAVRDLKYSFVSSGQTAPYLWGGTEGIRAWPAYHNNDVNADGDADDVVAGLNEGDPHSRLSLDNTAMPLPLNVHYTYVTSTGDSVVDELRQGLWYRAVDGNLYLGPYGAPVRWVRTDVAHQNQTDDVATVVDAVTGPFRTVAAGDGPTGEAVSVGVWPNPARGPVTLAYELPEAASGRATIRDALGRVVRTVEVVGRGGEGAVRFDVAGLAAGAYVVTLVADGGGTATTVFTVAR